MIYHSESLIESLVAELHELKLEIAYLEGQNEALRIALGRE